MTQSDFTNRSLEAGLGEELELVCGAAARGALIGGLDADLLLASPAPDTVWLLDQAPLVAEEGKLRLGRDSLVIRNTALSIEDCTVGEDN